MAAPVVHDDHGPLVGVQPSHLAVHLDHLVPLERGRRVLAHVGPVVVGHIGGVNEDFEVVGGDVGGVAVKRTGLLLVAHRQRLQRELEFLPVRAGQRDLAQARPCLFDMAVTLQRRQLSRCNIGKPLASALLCRLVTTACAMHTWRDAKLLTFQAFRWSNTGCDASNERRASSLLAHCGTPARW